MVIEKWDQTGSPEIPDRGETSEIPRPPFKEHKQKHLTKKNQQTFEEKKSIETFNEKKSTTFDAKKSKETFNEEKLT